MTGTEAALRRYRALACSVGVGLIVLVFVGMPLRYGAGVRAVVAVVGPVHGVLYIVYLATALDLARRTRLSVLRLLAMIGAGLLPFLAFVVERRVTAWVRGRTLTPSR